jgi:hypothetical protein
MIHVKKQVISSHGASGFVHAASFIGYLIERGMLSHDLVRLHLTKPLTNHHYNHRYNYAGEITAEDQLGRVRANAIYQLFAIARNTLLQGLLEPEDVLDCFEILEIFKADARELKVLCVCL